MRSNLAFRRYAESRCSVVSMNRSLYLEAHTGVCETGSKPRARNPRLFRNTNSVFLAALQVNVFLRYDNCTSLKSRRFICHREMRISHSTLGTTCPKTRNSGRQPRAGARGNGSVICMQYLCCVKFGKCV